MKTDELRDRFFTTNSELHRVRIEFLKQLVFAGSTLLGLLATLDSHTGSPSTIGLYIALPLCVLCALLALWCEAWIARRDYQNAKGQVLDSRFSDYTAKPQRIGWIWRTDVALTAVSATAFAASIAALALRQLGVLA